MTNYLAELYVQPTSPLIDKTFVETRLGETYNLDVIGVMRNGRVLLGALPNFHIRAGDILPACHLPDNLLAIKKLIGDGCAAYFGCGRFRGDGICVYRLFEYG